MSEPEFRVVQGNPTPEEEAVIRETILRIWRDDQAEAARVSGRSAWVVAARAEATGASPEHFRRDPSAWRAALVPVRRTVHGDAK